MQEIETIAAEACQDIKDIVSTFARPEIDRRVFQIIKAAIEKAWRKGRENGIVTQMNDNANAQLRAAQASEPELDELCERPETT